MRTAVRSRRPDGGRGVGAISGPTRFHVYTGWPVNCVCGAPTLAWPRPPRVEALNELLRAARAMTSHAEAAPAASSGESTDALVVRLFREEGASLVRLARLFTDDRNAAEDLVQEAFIRLHRSADRIRDPAKAAAYLRSIVLNLARDHNRRGLMSLRHREAIRSESSPEVVEDTVVSAEDQAGVVEALRSLSPRQRDCLVLRFYLELSEREIADTLSISPNSVKTHCRRGLVALQAMLEGAR